MAEDTRSLDVWCFDRLAGRLVDGAAGAEFSYDPQWLADGLPPLSQSLPLDGDSTAAAIASFFGGLLPEGQPRTLLARRLGVSVNNDFSMLAAIGGDTAGAISLQRPGERPARGSEDVEVLDDDELTQLIDELPTRPMHADEDGAYRLSLAGAQDKLPVVVGSDGRVALTAGQTPSTHILKRPIDRLDDTVANEAFCPAVGRLLGIDTVDAIPRRVRDREFLLVERYDRRLTGSVVQRLHQEDFCQALGVPAARKYQAEGGPSLADCFALVRRATDVPAREVVKLLDAVVLSFLVGNHDAHGKNFSLLYLPEASATTVAPAYDVLSTVAYHQSHSFTRKMAMSIGGEYRAEYLRPRHLDRMLGQTGLGAAAARRRLRAYAKDAPAVARHAKHDLRAAGWHAPVIDRIVEIVERRAAWLDDLAAPVAPKA